MSSTQPDGVSRVIAPTDFSEAALSGLRAARRHAEALGAPIVVVHVFDRAALEIYAPYLRTVQEENVSMMNSIEGTLGEQLTEIAGDVFEGFEEIETRILHDSSPARAIASFAEPGDMIVISTHGRTGISRVLMGSVAEKLVRLAPCPVLTVPARDGRHDG